MSVQSSYLPRQQAGTGRAADAGIPFSRLVRAELRKLTDTRASRLLLIAMAAATPIVVVVMLPSRRRATSSTPGSSTSPRPRRSSCCPRWPSWSSPASGASEPA